MKIRTLEGRHRRLPRSPGERADEERQVAAARALLGKAAFAAAWAVGRALPMEQAVRVALGESA